MDYNEITYPVKRPGRCVSEEYGVNTGTPTSLSNIVFVKYCLMFFLRGILPNRRTTSN